MQIALPQDLVEVRTFHRSRGVHSSLLTFCLTFLMLLRVITPLVLLQCHIIQTLKVLNERIMWKMCRMLIAMISFDHVGDDYKGLQ